MSSKPRYCSYCQEEVQGLRVRCAVCPDFKLCLQCFSAGAEIGQHKNDEPYQFVDAGMPCLFGKKMWTPQEEIHLLDATEYYGFGNWEDIANHIETRTPDEAKEEYVHRYLEATLGRMAWAPALRRRPRYRDPLREEKGALSHAAIAKMPLLDVSVQEATQLGYMLLRDDFEKEFDNEAEYLISNLSINHAEDDCLDIALKLTQVDMYTQRLRERARRKRICKDYMLVSQFFSLMKDRPNFKKKPRETRVLEERTRVLCQFQTAEEHDQLLVNLQREKNLRRRLIELLICRRNGITKFEDCESFYNYRQQHIGSSSPGSSLSVPHLFLSSQKRKEKSEGYSSTNKSCMPLIGSHASWPLPAADSSLSALLSSAEEQLCSSLNIPFSQYISVKTLLVADNLGFSFHPSCQHDRAVADFVNHSGWISSPS